MELELPLSSSQSLALTTDSSEGTSDESPKSGHFGDYEIEELDSGQRFIPSPTIPSFTASFPSHDDSLHPTNLINNIVSDTAAYLTILPLVFDVPLENCAAAGILGNIAGAIVNSAYFTEKAVGLFPEGSRELIKSGAKSLDNTLRTVTHPPYLAYYLVGWHELGVTTAPKICAFIIASSFVRQIAKSLLESERVKGTLVQQANSLTDVNQQKDSSIRALFRVMREFTPELVGAFARSGFKNLDQYAEGKLSGEEVFRNTLFSGAVFAVATFFYYVAYRAMEQAEHRALGVYGKAAESDVKKIQELQQGLQKKETNAVTSSDQVLQARAIAISKSFSFLQGPLTSLFKDPIYRALMKETYCHRENLDSREAKKAFEALDAVELLKKFGTSFEKGSIPVDQQRAFDELLRLLDIEPPESYVSLSSIENNALNALEKMFQTYSTATTSSSHRNLERVKLLEERPSSHRWATMPGYGAIQGSQA